MAVAGVLRVGFVDDFDGSGELIAHAESGGFSGNGRAYFNIDEIKKFADAIAGFPLSDSSRPSISGGHGSLNGPGHGYQEHLGITVYPIDSRGHIGIQIRMMSRLDRDSRPESQQSARIELETTYEALSRFSRSLIALLLGNADEAVLAGEV